MERCAPWLSQCSHALPTGERGSSDGCEQVRALGKCRVVKSELLQLSISSKERLSSDSHLEPGTAATRPEQSR